jgi:hypothetical protein
MVNMAVTKIGDTTTSHLGPDFASALPHVRLRPQLTGALPPRFGLGEREERGVGMLLPTPVLEKISR